MVVILIVVMEGQRHLPAYVIPSVLLLTHQVYLIPIIFIHLPNLFNYLSRTGNIYVAEFVSHRIRKVTISTSIISTIAGSSTSGSYSGDTGPATSANLYYPSGVALDSSGIIESSNSILMFLYYSFYSQLGNVYIADQYNHRIRKVTVSTGVISTVVGTGTGSYNGDSVTATAATLNYPTGITFDSAGITIHICTTCYSFIITIISQGIYTSPIDTTIAFVR